MASKSRPRLSLNITCAQSRPSTVLHCENITAPSSTVHNTFRNAYAFSGPFTTSSGQSGDPILITQDASHNIDIALTPIPSPPSTSSSYTSDASDSPPHTPLPIPYVLPPHLKSILTNSPISKRHASPIVALPAMEACSVYSTSKRVDFRAPGKEDVYTIDYTYVRSTSSSRDSSPPSENESITRGKREHLATSPLDDEDSERQPYGSRRRKRRRDWTWTLSTMSIDEAMESASSNAITTAMPNFVT